MTNKEHYNYQNSKLKGQNLIKDQGAQQVMLLIIERSNE